VFVGQEDVCVKEHYFFLSMSQSTEAINDDWVVFDEVERCEHSDFDLSMSQSYFDLGEGSLPSPTFQGNDDFDRSLTEFPHTLQDSNNSECINNNSSESLKQEVITSILISDTVEHPSPRLKSSPSPSPPILQEVITSILISDTLEHPSPRLKSSPSPSPPILQNLPQSETQDNTWWRKMHSPTSLGFAALAVGAASIVAITLSRSSQNK
jgi:hypothetical protein